MVVSDYAKDHLQVIAADIRKGISGKLHENEALSYYTKIQLLQHPC